MHHCESAVFQLKRKKRDGHISELPQRAYVSSLFPLWMFYELMIDLKHFPRTRDKSVQTEKCHNETPSLCPVMRSVFLGQFPALLVTLVEVAVTIWREREALKQVWMWDTLAFTIFRRTLCWLVFSTKILNLQFSGFYRKFYLWFDKKKKKEELFYWLKQSRSPESRP